MVLDIGRPVVIRSDGGPQFRSGFDAWCKEMAIKHELSSSYNPQSNGHAEQAVKTVKSLLKKTDTFDQFKVALTEWRNTPRFDGLSPAQWFLGYRQRTTTPGASRAYNIVTDKKLAQHSNRGGMRQESKKKHHDRSAV